AGLEAEHAGIPQVLAAVEVALRGGQVGFLDKAFDPEAGAQRIAFFDVAEAGFRVVGLDAEGDQVAGFGQVAGLAHRFGERDFIENQMVGGHYQQLRVVAKMRLHMQGGHCNG
ncbi:hypothetical protein U8M49_27355, partial [Klebsiella pneumoniae]